MEIQDVIEHKNDKEYILEVVKENGKFLEFVSENLKDDEEVVKVALHLGQFVMLLKG